MDLEAAVKSTLPLVNLTAELQDLNNSFNHMLRLSIPEKVTFVPGNAFLDEQEEKKSKQKRVQKKRKQEDENGQSKKRKNEKTPQTHATTNDINNNNDSQTNAKESKQKLSKKKEDKKDTKEKFTLTLTNGEIVCCRAPPNPSNDYYWLAKICLTRDQRTFANPKQQVLVQWFENDPCK